MRYSVEPRARRYVKGYGFLSFAKNIGKNISNKYSQKLADSAKKSATDAIKTAAILLKGVSETIKNEAKKQKGGFLSMLLGTLGAILLGDMLFDKGVIRAGEGTAGVAYGSKRSSIKISPLKKFGSTTSINKL